MAFVPPPPGFAPLTRAVRQSGLKKPRPLLKQSVSVQEQISNVNGDEDQARPDRQISLENSRSLPSQQTSPGMTNLVVCKEIEALSASLFSELGDDDTDDSSSDRDVIDAAKFFPKSKPGERNINYNNIASTHSRPKEVTQDRVFHDSRKALDSHSTGSVISSRQISTESASSSRSRLNRSRQVEQEESNNTRQPKNTAGPCEESDGIGVVTLMTGVGEELVLTGRSMKTILRAARALLRELQAKIVKIEQISDDEEELPQTKERTRSSGDISRDVNTLTRSETQQTTYNRALESNDRPSVCAPGKMFKQYSKEELLRLSVSDLSTKPPHCWNLLSVSPDHNDVCLPAEKVIDYFDPDFFSYHDGTLVIDERSERRSKRDVTHKETRERDFVSRGD